MQFRKSNTFLWDQEKGDSFRCGKATELNNGKGFQLRVFHYVYPGEGLISSEGNVKKIRKIMARFKDYLDTHPGLGKDQEREALCFNKKECIVNPGENEMLTYAEIIGDYGARLLANDIHGLMNLKPNHRWGVENPDELHTFFRPGKVPFKSARLFGIPSDSADIDPETRPNDA